MNTITLLFAHDKGDRISRLMAWFSRADWTHVALLGNNEVIEASGIGLPGVRVVPLAVWLNDHPGAVAREIPHPHPDLVREYMLSQLGKDYDWRWLFGWLFRLRDWQDDEEWVCSELIAWAAEKSGKPLFSPGSRWRVTPQMLYDISQEAK